ncbi:short chain dehydrogenase/reductase [Lophiotrema nucula]|uniref:Short chain dehydrogenase/reductase n=1 Tax=Lophiotrema nucula TaxID=690887 RepID=A0A6A5YHV4_9PLEO|nr:short chain dehydrogenase/reductase [Lophiotrema nucula]
MASSIVLITGANSGLGFAISKVLATTSSDFHIIIASRTLDKANEALASIEALQPKGTLSAIYLDVTDKSSIQAAAAQVEQTFGHLDVLINNAAVGGLDIEDVETRFKVCLETNVTGPALVSEAFRPLLLKSSNAYSIFVSSGQRTLPRNALQTPPHFGTTQIQSGPAYQVSKAALNMLAVLEARDYGGKGLKVFVLSPGFFESGLRGNSEEARTGWGKAGSAEVPASVVLSILRGDRDDDVGRFVHEGGVYEW